VEHFCVKLGDHWFVRYRAEETDRHTNERR